VPPDPTARSRQRPSLAGIDRLVIDGNNLLHRTAGGPGPTSVRLLLPRLRAALPPGAHVSLVLDGMPDPGAPMREQVGPIAIQHAGRRSADDAIVEIVERQTFGERAATVVVTDDRSLTERVRRLGALPRRLDWLQTALELPRRGPRSSGQTLGAGRPPRDAGRTAPRAEDAATSDDGPERRAWQPGRGATRKRGNPRRRRSR
jgi:hypothetical protein